MRGKGKENQTECYNQRITPAYAGKRSNFEDENRQCEDHPRLCGEKFRFLEISPAHEGSPPPMRGKADVVLNRIDRIGITPAYAGKSQLSAAPSATQRGSPPPMRGKVKFVMMFNSSAGITPAYAGKSQKTGRIHPHRLGSPPPMRGKVQQAAVYLDIPRITPAYAGKRHR